MAPTAQVSPQQANMFARQAIVGSAVKMTQQVFSQSVVPANQNVINVQPRNVGLILGFYVLVSGTLTNDATNGTTLTEFGPANLLSNIAFYDLNNNVRINTTGWHMSLLNSARHNMPYQSVDTLSTYPIGFGRNFTDIIQAPATQVASHADAVNMLYWVPLAYSEQDLRGAVYGNVVNATMNLQLTLNPTPYVASGDATNAVYSGNTGTFTSATVTVYQVYYDQLPVNPQNGQVILPFLDLSTIYELKNTSLTGLTVNQDFPIPYSNFRDFLSTIAVFDNGGTLNAGTDINYWALQSANFTNIFKVTPQFPSIWSRNLLRSDFPKAVYYIPTRLKPISTVQYGNMQLVLNPSTVNSNAAVLMGYEAMALVNIIGSAASLPGS